MSNNTDTARLIPLRERIATGQPFGPDDRAGEFLAEAVAYYMPQGPERTVDEAELHRWALNMWAGTEPIDHLTGPAAHLARDIRRKREEDPEGERAKAQQNLWLAEVYETPELAELLRPLLDVEKLATYARHLEEDSEPWADVVESSETFTCAACDRESTGQAFRFMSGGEAPGPKVCRWCMWQGYRDAIADGNRRRKADALLATLTPTDEWNPREWLHANGAPLTDDERQLMGSATVDAVITARLLAD